MNNFKIGDIIKCIDAGDTGLKLGEHYTIKNFSSEYLMLKENGKVYRSGRFELVEDETTPKQLAFDTGYTYVEEVNINNKITELNNEIDHKREQINYLYDERKLLRDRRQKLIEQIMKLEGENE